MFRNAKLLAVVRQIRQLKKSRCQELSTVARCRFCCSAQNGSWRVAQHRHQSTAAAEATAVPSESPASTVETHAQEEPIPPPNVEGAEKTYSPKVHNIVNQISNLTLLEVADLNELLKKTLNISNAPMMMAGAMPAGPAAAAPQEEEEEGEQQQVSFTVKLTSFEAAKKVALIKEIKGLLPEMNLVQAKKFVESAPVTVRTDLQKDDAEKLLGALKAAGGQAEIV